jgi:Papain-like cysteine protease AvrRpt2
MDMPTAASYLGSPFTEYLVGGDSLPSSQINYFMKKANFKALTGQSRPAEVWESLLKTHGPLAVGVDADNPDNYMAHLVTMYGISGDETPKGTTVKLIDPKGGRLLSIKFETFGKLYGANDVVNAPFNVFHNL